MNLLKLIIRFAVEQKHALKFRGRSLLIEGGRYGEHFQNDFS